MSDFSTVVDAIVADLQANVAALASVNVHRYEPWDPEELASYAGDGNHLAVWPAAEAEIATPFTSDGSIRVEQRYQVLYWEHLGTEGGTRFRDETAAAALLDLHNAIRARFVRKAAVTLGGASDTRYIGAVLPTAVATVRWMLITLTSFREFTPT